MSGERVFFEEAIDFIYIVCFSGPLILSSDCPLKLSKILSESYIILPNPSPKLGFYDSHPLIPNDPPFPYIHFCGQPLMTSSKTI